MAGGQNMFAHREPTEAVQLHGLSLRECACDDPGQGAGRSPITSLPSPAVTASTRSCLLIGRLCCGMKPGPYPMAGDAGNGRDFQRAFEISARFLGSACLANTAQKDQRQNRAIQIILLITITLFCSKQPLMKTRVTPVRRAPSSRNNVPRWSLPDADALAALRGWYAGLSLRDTVERYLAHALLVPGKSAWHPRPHPPAASLLRA